MKFSIIKRARLFKKRHSQKPTTTSWFCKSSRLNHSFTSALSEGRNRNTDKTNVMCEDGRDDALFCRLAWYPECCLFLSKSSQIWFPLLPSAHLLACKAFLSVIKLFYLSAQTCHSIFPLSETEDGALQTILFWRGHSTRSLQDPRSSIPNQYGLGTELNPRYISKSTES